MRSGVLLDTGPLVAYLYPRDRHHDWAREQFARLDPPLLSCEAVLTEACFLVVRNGQPATRVLEMLRRGVLQIGLALRDETAAIAALMERYANVPMSLADACLVRLAEVTGSPICTLDGDFAIYRAGRRSLTIIAPEPHSSHEP